MPRYTDRWGLSILGSGDSLQSDGFKFCDADRRLIDRLLSYAAEEHRHTGAIGEDLTPAAALNLFLSTTGGSIASGARYYYRYTIIDALGSESAPSPVSYIDTPPTVATPTSPAISYVAGSGTLQPGGYSYVLSAYKGASLQETKATNSSFITIPGAAPGNSVSLILPGAPAGADGYNVYRKSPSGMHYLYIASIVAPTALQVWVDDGSIDGDCDRSLPSINRTGGTNVISVAFPGDIPFLNERWSWQVYRSTDPNRWGRSLLQTINPIDDPPYTPLSFNDTGLAALVGGPPAKAQIINAPPKINLSDAAEVQGSLPPGLFVAPHMLTFAQPGPVTVADGTFTWVCDFDMADVIGVRLYLGPGSVPAAQPVIADIVALRPSHHATPTWESLFDTAPRIAIGQNATGLVKPNRQHLERGDVLSADIVQAGEGATPTDHDLTINVLLYVKEGSETTSHTWATT